MGVGLGDEDGRDAQVGRKDASHQASIAYFEVGDVADERCEIGTLKSEVLKAVVHAKERGGVGDGFETGKVEEKPTTEQKH